MTATSGGRELVSGAIPAATQQRLKAEAHGAEEEMVAVLIAAGVSAETAAEVVRVILSMPDLRA